MPVVPLTFGEPLDRDTGIAAVRPATMKELTNMQPRSGKVQARKGMQIRAILPSQGGAACSAVILIQPLLAVQESLAVGWYASTRQLHVYRLSGTAESPIHVGLWATLAVGAAPRAVAAENFGFVLLAHDEARIAYRAATMMYRVAGTPALETLQAEFDTGGVQPIRFRGVRQWGDYMTGWGFGSDLEDHPEYLRLSLPGEPYRWEPSHYFVVGSRGETITGVGEAGSQLLAFKSSRTFRVTGSTPLNFGIVPLYALIGCPSQALITTVEGNCFFWSHEGPRVTSGGDSADLAQPLNLHGPDLPSLPAAASLDNGYAIYRPGIRVVEWVFGRRGYALALEGDGLRWAYSDRAASTVSGALLYTQGPILAVSTNSTGYSIVTEIEAMGSRATLTLSNLALLGSEIGELWIKEAAGDWTKRQEFRVTGATQTVELAGLFAPRDYKVRVRHRRGGTYTTGYTDTNPDNWVMPVGTKYIFSTEFPAPVLESAEWSRVSANEQVIILEFTPGDKALEYVAIRTDQVTGEERVMGSANVQPSDTTGELRIHKFVAGRSYTWAVEGRGPGIRTPRSNSMALYSGPIPTVTPVLLESFSDGCATEQTRWKATWVNGIAGAPVEMSYGTARGLSSDTVPLVTNTVVGTSASLCIPSRVSAPMIFLRHVVTSFGVKDYTEARRVE
jgi:hypothetical protein